MGFIALHPWAKHRPPDEVLPRVAREELRSSGAQPVVAGAKQNPGSSSFFDEPGQVLAIDTTLLDSIYWP